MEVTDHAYDRAKERFGWNKKTLERMSQKALSKGIRHRDTKGSLCRYITKLFFQGNFHNNIRIYGQGIFIFSNETLITVWHMPNNLRGKLKFQKKDK